MKPEEYDYLEATLTGKKGRDKKLEGTMGVSDSVVQQPDDKVLTPQEMELKQREYDAMMFGKNAVKRYARHVDGLQDVE